MAVDPNRSFDKNGPPPAEEAAALMALVASLGVDRCVPLVHPLCTPWWCRYRGQGCRAFGV